MGTETLIRIFDLLAVVVSIVLFWVVISFSKSLEGSFFGRYSKLMITAAILFGLGFVVELAGEFMPGVIVWTDMIHHIFLITSGVLLVYAGVILPKEATKVLKETGVIK